ncbi:hypothetical protein CD798_08580 [Bacillaceae bacterium SAOS 7]|nr:hypothetical protein CD798_08580 [Bacillaceae bacterium SAOS 7]
MKKIIGMSALAFMLAGCGNDPDEIQGEKSKAKTGEETDAASENDEAKEKDIWTYYENATWTDDYNGLKSEIQKVVVSNEAPAMDENGQEVIKSAVGVKFKLENTTEGKFTTYPDQAVLVTSTGEQIDMPDMLVSDHIGGEIDKGVIKEGNLIWYLERGEADKIEWIKMKWSGHQGGESEIDSEFKEWETELKLK